jgi:uncharacterized protein YbcI
MADPGVGPQSGLPAEIGNSLAMVWRRYVGRRPSSVETTVNGTRVACLVRDSVHDFDVAMTAGEVDAEGTSPAIPTVAGYEREAIKAVANVTRRRVVAFVSDHNAKSDTAKEVFLLDRPPWRQPSIFVDQRLD